MDERDITERIIRIEERSKSNTHRLDKLEPIVDEIHAMSEAMVRLIEEVKHTNEGINGLKEKVQKIDDRVDVIEKAPGEEWSNAKKTVVTAIISTLGGAAATGIIFLIYVGMGGL